MCCIMLRIFVASILFCGIVADQTQHHPGHPAIIPPPSGNNPYPRYVKCSNAKQGEEWKWWQNEQGCIALFTSISMFAPSASSGPSTQAPTSTSTAESTARHTSKTTKSDLESLLSTPSTVVQHSNLDPSLPGLSQGAYFPRYRGQRMGGLFAGVGVASDFYTGGFVRYPRPEMAGQQEQRPTWSQLSPGNDAFEVQRDALEDMLNDRRRRDTQACINFRAHASKLINSEPLEAVCCNIVCYCDELQNVTTSKSNEFVQDDSATCGGFDWSSWTQSQGHHVPTPPSAAANPQGPEFYLGLVHQPHTVEENENGTMGNNATESHTDAPKLPESTTTSHPVTRGLDVIQQARMAHQPFPSAHVVAGPEDMGLKKVQEVLSGGLATAVLTADKHARPRWTPVTDEQNVFYKKSPFGVVASNEWANYLYSGDAIRRNQ